MSWSVMEGRGGKIIQAEPFQPAAPGKVLPLARRARTLAR
jgi:hypothetical protein